MGNNSNNSVGKKGGKATPRAKIRTNQSGGRSRDAKQKGGALDKSADDGRRPSLNQRAALALEFIRGARVILGLDRYNSWEVVEILDNVIQLLEE